MKNIYHTTYTIRTETWNLLIWEEEIIKIMNSDKVTVNEHEDVEINKHS